MEHVLNSPILTLIFVILLVVIYRTIKGSLNYDAKWSVVLSICVSILATLGMNSFLLGKAAHPIQIPYAALGISILFLLLIRLIGSEKLEDWFGTIFKKDPPSNIDKKRKNQTNNDRKK
ncbi:MAG: hypothetical protein ABFD91_08095 [Anaerohalosphaeraceae bacterium]